ncbi:MAG: hypothetical protein HYY93_09300 [Planctomycetes bacterium]|nr:hypothetical protein [Planctomycetota bacterium]
MFTVNRKELHEAIRTASRCLAGHSASPALQCVRLDATDDGLLVSATDLDIGATIGVPASGGVTGSGSVVVNCAQFGSVAWALAGVEDVPLEIEGDSITVGKSKLRSTVPASDFPEMPEAPKKVEAAYSFGPDFTRAVAFCAQATARIASRFALTGLFFDFPRGTLVGSDGKRLHLGPLGIPSKILPLILPPRLFAAVHPDGILIPKKKGKAETPEQVFFTFPNGIAYARPLEGTFPEYVGVVPKKHSASFDVERAGLIEGLKTVLPLVSEHAPGCIVSVDGALDLTVNNADTGAETSAQVEGVLTGDPVSVTINPHYLRDVVSALPGDRCRIYLSANDTPLLVEGETTPWFALIMPLKTEAPPPAVAATEAEDA